MARRAKSLEVLLASVNAAAPHRSRVADGWIGDKAHASRKSDHNPNKAGVVLAIDLTHDPKHGVDCEVLANDLIRDPRCKYVIWNRRIFNPSVKNAWRAYKGHPHNKHVHISVKPDAAYYDDDKPWDLTLIGEGGGEKEATK